jgi:hypothetical protein
MVDTAFDRAERGLGSTDLSVADIVAKTRGNPNEIMKLVMGGQINLTQGLLAKRLSDSVVAEQQKAAAPTTTVLQDSFPQLAPAMGGLQPPAQPQMQAPQGMGPVPPQAPMQAPPGMAEGGLAQLDFAAPDYAGGGIVAFAAGDELSSPEEWGAYFEEMASGAVPGVNVTSRRRSASRNAEVDGQPDSYHLLGAARDFTPPQGMTMGQLHRQLRNTFGEGYDIINEGNHVHVEPGPALGRAVRAGTPFSPANVSNLRTAESAPNAAAPSSAREALMGNIDRLTTPTDLNINSFLGQLPEQSREALQRYRERVESQEDPERARERSELGALFQSIGNVRPGMNPLEALAQGFATSGASMQAAEERGRTQELEQLRVAADLERVENQLGRENLQIAIQLAQAQAGRLDAAQARELQVMLAAMDDETKRAIQAAANSTSVQVAGIQATTARQGQNLDYAVSAYEAANPPAAATPSWADLLTYGRVPPLQGLVPGTGAMPAAAAPPRAPFPSIEQARAGTYNPSAGTSNYGLPPEGAVSRIR